MSCRLNPGNRPSLIEPPVRAQWRTGSIAPTCSLFFAFVLRSGEAGGGPLKSVPPVPRSPKSHPEAQLEVMSEPSPIAAGAVRFSVEGRPGSLRKDPEPIAS
jgi:hypothetical protein